MPPSKSATLRAENQRIDELLRGVEAGSLKHIRDINNAWPKGVHNIKRLLSVLFVHLDASKIPRFAPRQPVFREGTDPFNQAALIRECLCVLAGSDSIDDLNDSDCLEVVELFRSHLTDLLAALEFLAVYSPLLVGERPGLKDTLQFGNIIGASIVTKLFHYGRALFEAEEDHASFEVMVPYVLKSWMRWICRMPLPYETKLTPKEYFFYEPLYMMLFSCFDDNIVFELMQDNIEAFDQKTLKRLIHSFAYRYVEWTTIHKPKDEAEAKQLNTRNLGHLTTIAGKLGASRRFHVALIRSELLPLSLTIGWEFRFASSIRPCGGSIATHIASEMLPQWHWPAWALVRSVPVLIKAGLLKFVVEDYLTIGLDQPKRWHDRDPLQDIFRIAHHPKIFEPLYAELEGIHGSPEWQKRLSKTIEDAIDKNMAVGTRMMMFGVFLKTHEDSYIRSTRRRGYYSQCECIDHLKNPDRPGHLVPSECSQCQSVVYCSKKCQEMDWEVLHKDECLFLRHVRIERELHGLWLSHKDRMRYLQFLELAYVDALVSEELGQARYVRPEITSEIKVYCLNTVTMPIGFEAFSVEEFLSHKKGGELMFSGDRFRNVIQRGKELAVGNDRIRILASVSGIGGDHWVTALGVYNLIRRPETIRKDNFPCYMLLASHVMVRSCGKPDQGVSDLYNNALASFRAAEAAEAAQAAESQARSQSP